MVRITLRNNPIIASLLAWAVPGLGHLYLRRWLRAFGWLLGFYVVATFLVPPAVLDAYATGTLDDPFAVLPLAFVLAASMFDAYRIAKRMANEETGETSTRATADPETGLVTCPSCRKESDPELGFCHWCTTEFDVADSARDETVSEATN